MPNGSSPDATGVPDGHAGPDNRIAEVPVAGAGQAAGVKAEGAARRADSTED